MDLFDFQFAYDITKYKGLQPIENTYKKFINVEQGRHCFMTFLAELQRIGYRVDKYNNKHYHASDGEYVYEMYVSII